MEAAEGARSFLASGAAYDHFMGRYSRALAPVFADAAGVTPKQVALDVGCGPGALTSVLVERLGADHVCAFDPSPPFVEECAVRHPGVDVRIGRAEAIPFEDRRFDRALAQLVVPFVSDADAAAAELRRVLRPGGVVAACVWDAADGMQMLHAFWDAAAAVVPGVDQQRNVRFGRAGETRALLDRAGFIDVTETTLRVHSTYGDLDDLWAGFLAGIGPAGSFLVSLPERDRAAMREALLRRLGSPSGAFTLGATARCALGRAPAP